MLPPELQYRNIIEWMFTHDGKYPDKIEWRKEFLNVLRFNILHETSEVRFNIFHETSEARPE